MCFTDFEKKFNEEEVLFEDLNFSDENYKYKIHNVYRGELTAESFFKESEKHMVTEKGGKVRRVTRNFCGIKTFEINEEFFKKYKIKFFKESKVESLNPSKNQQTKLAKFGKYEHEFYPGGFISNSRFKENNEFFEKKMINKNYNFPQYDNNKLTKFEKFAAKIVDKKEVLEYAVCAKGIFGEWSKSYEILLKRAENMGATEKELDLAKKYNTDDEFSLNRNYKW